MIDQNPSAIDLSCRHEHPGHHRQEGDPTRRMREVDGQIQALALFRSESDSRFLTSKARRATRFRCKFKGWMSLKPSRQTNRTGLSARRRPDAEVAHRGSCHSLPSACRRNKGTTAINWTLLGMRQIGRRDVAVTKRNFIRIPPTSDGKSAEPTTTVLRFYFRNIASTRAPSQIERPGSRFLPGVAEEPLLTKFGRSGLDRSIPCSLFSICWTPRRLNAFPRCNPCHFLFLC